MFDLIGKKYELGADGSGDSIDCIHLCYEVLERLNIPTPTFNPNWYDWNKLEIARAIRGWGNRIAEPTYNGDICLLAAESYGVSFSVAWDNGLLTISPATERVKWVPFSMAQPLRSYRYSPTKNS